MILLFFPPPGREEKSEGAVASDSRGDPDRAKLDRLHSEPLRKGEESFQLHCPLPQLPGHDIGDPGRRCPLLHPPSIPHPNVGREQILEEDRQASLGPQQRAPRPHIQSARRRGTSQLQVSFIENKRRGATIRIVSIHLVFNLQGVETVADRRLRERIWKSRRLESNEEGAEEEAQGRVAACPAAGSRGSTITEHPEDGPAAPE